MTLTTHAIIAAAVAKPFANFHPVFVFLAALASHYCADAIPHWDYPLKSVEKEGSGAEEKIEFTRRTFLADLTRVAIDAILGAAIVTIVVQPKTLRDIFYTAAIVIGGILPDFLQGVYYGLHLNFLKPHQMFHDWIHTKIKLGPYPFMGVPFQCIIVFVALFFLL